MKKSFTLLEVIISITLFMIILLFLYKVLDQSKLSNNLFVKKEEIQISENKLYDIFLLDILKSKADINITLDKEKNSIVIFKSLNSNHNVYYTNIAYMISSSSKLVRIESKEKFKLVNSSQEFYDTSYIDVLLDNIEYFEVKYKKSEKSVVFAIKQKNKERVIFKTFIINS